MMITFVIGIQHTQSIGGCVTASLFIHYFSMASVMWMAAQAWLMFQKFVIVFVQITTRYIATVSLICWCELLDNSGSFIRLKKVVSCMFPHLAWIYTRQACCTHLYNTHMQGSMDKALPLCISGAC